MEMPNHNGAVIQAEPGPSIRPGEKLRAVILLGGTVRNSGFGAAIKRSLLDLPIGRGITLLEHWGREIAGLCQFLSLSKLPVRLVIGRTCFWPNSWIESPGVHLSIERDPMEFRGTGGVLRDLALEYEPDDLILVATATLLSADSLSHQVERLISGSGDVRLLAGPNQVPAGLILLRCGCLSDIPANGYVDLKEQALGAIANKHSVRVVQDEKSSGHSIRCWNDYLNALRLRHLPPDAAQHSAYQENWQPLFRIVEDAAVIAPSANIHDSVVLAGGRVEAKATVVRSLVGTDGVVLRGQTIFGEMITATGRTA